MHFCVSTLLLTIMIAVIAVADEPVGGSGKTAEEQQIAEALELTTDAARQFSLAVAGENEVPLKFQSKSLLQWSNPAAGTLYGNVFIWTHEERPQAIASFYKWYAPFTHAASEFHSLSTEPIVARRNDKVVWQPKRGGIEWKPLPGDSSPSDAGPRRLIQLRQIARQFSIDKTDRDQLEQNLRLLPQPIYRYTSPSEEVVDGAMFVFVQGTDPEVFLLLEATPQNDAKSLVWRYALIRMNSVMFVANYQQVEVWRAEILPWKQVTNQGSTYFARRLK